MAGGRRDRREDSRPPLPPARRGDRPRPRSAPPVTLAVRLYQVKRREAIFWQTQKTARAANPGGQIPRRRALAGTVTITVDTRERYPYKFTHQGAETVRATVVAGDYT